MIAIVIVNFRTAALTVDCLTSLASERTGGEPFSVVLVDNFSEDDSLVVLTNAIAQNGWKDWVEVILADRNGGFACGNNLGIRHVLAKAEQPRYVLLLNPDTVVRKGAILALRVFMDSNRSAGIAGSRLEDPDGTSQRAARRFPGVLSEFESALCFGPVSRLLSKWTVAPPELEMAHECDWLPGASLMIRRDVLDNIGLLDEGYFMYYEEVDFCARARRAVWTVWYVPESRVVHLVGQSSGVTSRSGKVKRLPKYWFESRHRFFLKNRGIGVLLLANLAWFTGLLLNRIRAIVQRKSSSHPPCILSDSLRNELKMLTKNV